MLEFTDVLDFEVLAISLTDEFAPAHGSITWRMVAPVFVQAEFRASVLTREGVLVESFHAFENSAFKAVAGQAHWAYEQLVQDGVPEVEAVAVLPGSVRASFLVTMDCREIIEHLSRWPEHSEVVRTLDQGLVQTLAEHTPKLTDRLRALLPEGVFPSAFAQEEIVEQEAQHVQGAYVLRPR